MLCGVCVGLYRPAESAHTPAPLLRPIVSVSFRSRMGAWADMCRGRGWDCVLYCIWERFAMCRVGHPRGGPLETPPGDLGPSILCSLCLG